MVLKNLHFKLLLVLRISASFNQIYGSICCWLIVAKFHVNLFAM